jgi:hypothetical protein
MSAVPALVPGPFRAVRNLPDGLFPTRDRQTWHIRDNDTLPLDVCDNI